MGFYKAWISEELGEYMNALVQERHKSIAKALELCLSCTNHRYKMIFCLPVTAGRYATDTHITHVSDEEKMYMW